MPKRLTLTRPGLLVEGAAAFKGWAEGVAQLCCRRTCPAMCGDVDRNGKNRARDVPNPVPGDPWITPRCTIKVVPRPPFVAASLISFDIIS